MLQEAAGRGHARKVWSGRGNQTRVVSWKNEALQWSYARVRPTTVRRRARYPV